MVGRSFFCSKEILVISSSVKIQIRFVTFAYHQIPPMTKTTKFLIVILIGFLFGIFIFLPINELTTYFEYEYHFQTRYTVWEFIWRQLRRALLLQTPLKFFFYLLFGGIMGVISYFTMSVLRRRDAVIMQLEEELGKNLNALISRGEDDSLEFKSSFRYDYKQQKVNRALEGVIIKTLAGFMNTRGGSLLIGVADDGSILGLQNDYQTLSRKDSDGYTQLIMSTVSDKIGTPACRLLRVLFHKQDGKEICRIITLPSPVPVYVREDNQARFFIRTGSGTREMDIQEAIIFIKAKWG
jgi:hypothetical protein